MSPDLAGLFFPRAIAVIGATNRPGRPGRIILEQLQRSRLPLYPVNPNESEVLGCPAVAHPTDLPDTVDLAVIAVKAGRAVQAAEACAERGIPFLIVVAGGFAEAGAEGEALESRLRAIGKQGKTRVLGPNTLGIFAPATPLDTIFVEHGDRALAPGGKVAFVSQSGSVGVEALGLASNTGFGMRAFVGLGNQCDLDALDFLNYFANDRQTRCLAFYLESLDHGRRFLERAAQVTTNKPVVVLKAGRSDTGARAVVSHTGRLAGSDQVVSGALRQYGIQRVFDDEALCDAAKTLSALPPPRGNRVAVLSPAGGYGVMAADHIELFQDPARLRMARLSAPTRETIQKASFPFAAPQNPVDLTASANDRMMAQALDAMLADPGVDMAICIAFFGPPAITDRLIEAIAEQAASSPKPVLVFTQYGPFTDEYLRRFHQAGVVGFPSVGRAVRAARFLAERAAILSALGVETR